MKGQLDGEVDAVALDAAAEGLAVELDAGQALTPGPRRLLHGPVAETQIELHVAERVPQRRAGRRHAGDPRVGRVAGAVACGGQR